MTLDAYIARGFEVQANLNLICGMNKVDYPLKVLLRLLWLVERILSLIRHINKVHSPLHDRGIIKTSEFKGGGGRGVG